MSHSPSQFIQDAISNMTLTNNGDNDMVNLNDPSFLLAPWKDITTFLDEATQEMEEGELIHLQSFTLFDAMAAIEIMDPRMDTGMVLENNESNKAPYDINQPLNPRQVIWIMDRLLACEMTWLSGHSLAQTVYTCAYFHHVQEFVDLPFVKSSDLENMDQTMDFVLKFYILGSVKCCYYIWKEMTSGNIFEEEDFTTNLFGLSLHEDLADDRILYGLQHIWEVLDTLNLEKSVLQALRDRLTMRRTFLQTVLYLSEHDHNCMNHVRHSLMQLREVLECSTSKNTTSILGTLELGQEVEGAFDPNIHRKLTSQAPPRSISLRTHQQSYQDLLLLTQRLQSICAATEYVSVESLMNYFACFAAAKPYPDAFSRSKLNTLFYTDCCILFKHHAIDLVKLAIWGYVLPPHPWLKGSDPNDPELLADAKSSLYRFLEQTVSVPLIDFFKIQCHNRARQRRILGKVIGEWEIIQDEARHVDKKFQDAKGRTPNYFSSWVYHMKARMMEQYLLLGYELDLYGEGEYMTIYWYLRLVLENDKPPPPAPQQQHENAIPSYGLEEIRLNSLYTQDLTSAKKSMATGTFKLLAAMKKMGIWKQQQLTFDDPQTRFTHRLKPFMNLASPRFPGFDRFLDDSATNYPITDIADDFLTARNILTRLLREPLYVSRTDLCHDASQKILLSMVKTCVTNNIVLQQLQQLDDSTTANVTLTFKHHPSWLTVELDK